MAEKHRLTGLLWLVKWLAIIALLVLIVDIFCVFVLWSPDGVGHLKNVLNQEIALLGLPQSDITFLAEHHPVISQHSIRIQWNRRHDALFKQLAAYRPSPTNRA